MFLLVRSLILLNLLKDQLCSKQSDNSNRHHVSYCSPGLPIAKAIDVNRGKFSETFFKLPNCNRYDVATYKAKAPYLSDAERKDLIKNVFVPDEILVFHETERCFRFECLNPLFTTTRYLQGTSKMLLFSMNIQ